MRGPLPLTGPWRGARPRHPATPGRSCGQSQSSLSGCLLCRPRYRHKGNDDFFQADTAMRHRAFLEANKGPTGWSDQREVVVWQPYRRPGNCLWVQGCNLTAEPCIAKHMDPLAPLVCSHADIRFAYPYAFNIAMIGREHHLETVRNE